MCSMESQQGVGDRKGVTLEPRGQSGHHPNMTLLIFQCSYGFQKIEAKVQEIVFCFLSMIFVDMRERVCKGKEEGEGGRWEREGKRERWGRGEGEGETSM